MDEEYFTEPEYITQKQLEEKLKSIKVNGFSHYSGEALSGLIRLVSGLTTISLITGVLTYGAMTLAYGPYDAGKVIYAELSGNKSLKHRHVETAKAIYSKNLHKQELDDKDIKNLYIELDVVSTNDKKPIEEDISWYNLLDWIEDND